MHQWTARQVVSELAKKRVSAVEYATFLLERAQAWSNLNAFVTLDHDHALSEARNADSGCSKGPFAGLPIAFKDAIGTRQLTTTAATLALRNHRPSMDAQVVTDLRSAGAFVYGKLNMHELSYGITSNNQAHGPVRNPYNPDHIPGGSSGGAGAAVAAGLAPVAIGTDTGGSVRIPAALCGVVGFRPSIGRYSQVGIIPVSHTRDTAGPLARSVDDVAMVDAAITGIPDQLETPKPSTIRLGLPNNHYLDNLHPDTRNLFETRLAELRHAGFDIVGVDVGGVEPPLESCGFPIAMWETKTDLTAYLKAHPEAGVSLEGLIEAATSADVKVVLSGLLAPEFEDMEPAYHDAIKMRRPALQSGLADCFADHRIDALIFPTTILPAARIGEDETVSLNGAALPTFPTFIHNTDPGSIAGLPGISLPAGLSPGGLPIGIELDGPAGTDRHLLAVAQAVERHLPPITHP
ncbi:indoleacetamide hydrolase [Ruegeria sp.]|uniref:indoleacetamide hydrolase n=1 Tax=Ruegeria sp. TaxID=1879320 RepID=UPI003B5C886D